MGGGCGFPSVTLMREKSDWEEILRQVERLPKYGAEASEWSKLLVPIIKRMIVSFYLPDSQEIKDFWLRACHSIGTNGSGTQRTVSGWLTAFCFWNKDGRRVELLNDPEHLKWDTETPFSMRKLLVMDGAEYPIISPGDIPAGVLSVPVIVEDESSGLCHKTTMVAGSVGLTVATKSGTQGRESVVWSRSGWWMLEDSVEKLQNFPELAAKRPRKVMMVDVLDHRN